MDSIQKIIIGVAVLLALGAISVHKQTLYADCDSFLTDTKEEIPVRCYEELNLK
jgi:hypothetical protein